MAGAGSLPPHKQAVLALVGRLIVHFENVSNGLYYRTEFLPDGELRQACSKLLELNEAILTNLRYVGLDDADASDPLSALLRNDSGYVSGAKR